MPVGDYYQKYGPIHRRRSGHTPELAHEPERPRAPAAPARTRRLVGSATGCRTRQQVRHPPASDVLPQADPLADTTLPYRSRVIAPTVPDAAISARERIATRRLKRRALVRRRVVFWRNLGIAVAAVCTVLLLLPYLIAFSYSNRALPGVSIQGVRVSNHDPAAIAATLEARYADFLRQPLTISYRNQVWTPALADLGARFDMDATIAAALAQGRTGDPFTRLRDLTMLVLGGIDLAPRVVIDEQQVQHYLLALAADVNHPPRDAALSVQYGKVIATPADGGRQLLPYDNTIEVLQALSSLQPQQITLRTRALEPTVNNQMLAVAQQQAAQILATPLVLKHGEREWVWQPAQIAELLTIRADQSSMQVQLDPERLAQAVEAFAVGFDSGSVEPRLQFAAGALEVIAPGRTGWRLDQARATRYISETLMQASAVTRTVRLPAEKLSPQITPEKLAGLGITELLGRGQSSFEGSAPYRITNIRAGAERMDGVLIAPREEFSFNTQLGEVNAENGFVQGYAVVNNRTALEWGGGVCQDSTTLFRAAFWAGLPITERHAHPFYISWYDRFGFGDYGDGAGLDAAIYTGQNDLRFVNDTDHWILIQVEMDEANQILTVDLYGTRKDRREVAFDGPYLSNETPPPATPVYVDDPAKPRGYLYQSDAARSGRDITVYRVIYEQGVEVVREPFVTRFQAWPNVYVRGVGGG